MLYAIFYISCDIKCKQKQIPNDEIPIAKEFIKVMRFSL